MRNSGTDSPGNPWASMVGDGQRAAEYVYDAFGRLLWQKGSDGTESRHYYDRISELLVREKPQAGAWRTKYVNALAQSDIGQVLARRTATGWTGGGVPSTWTDRYYHYDLLGNAVMESDHQGEVVAFVDMEAFGNVVAGGTGGPRLTTKWIDPDTGLYYFNARWYDAGRGMWGSKDPLIEDSYNRYTFVLENPVFYYDNNGLNAKPTPVPRPLPPPTPMPSSDDFYPPHPPMGPVVPTRLPPPPRPPSPRLPEPSVPSAFPSRLDCLSKCLPAALDASASGWTQWAWEGSEIAIATCERLKPVRKFYRNPYVAAAAWTVRGGLGASCLAMCMWDPNSW